MKKKQESKKKLIIVHGWEGYPEEGWFPWLKTEMEKRGWSVQVPAMPNTNQPEQTRWVPYLVTIAGEVDKNTFLVGHSLGCIIILRFLERLPVKSSIGGVVLVAGFDKPLKYKELKNFFHEPINWKKITSAAKRFTVIHSRDDGYVTADKAQNLARNTKARLVLVGGWGHFSSSDGVTNAPPILEELLSISK